MIYPLVSILFFVGFFYCRKKYKHYYEGDTYLWCFLLGILFFAVFIVTLGCGVSIYPTLLSQQSKVLALKSEIETIRSAAYPVESGSFVGGSLDNIEQSKTLSNYIRLYATEKAEYNRQLAYYQFVRTSLAYRLLAYGSFIDKRVMELDKL